MEHKKYGDLTQEQIKDFKSKGLIVQWAGYAGYCVFEPIYKIEDTRAYCDRLQLEANQMMESRNKSIVDSHRTGRQAMLELFVILSVIFVFFFVLIKIINIIHYALNL
jgi:hypothetical protein